MTLKKKSRLLIVLGIFFIVLFFIGDNFAWQVKIDIQGEKAQVEENPEKIVPSPKDIKEKTAIYVFVAWMWAVIIVLLFILRLKTKEADRLYYLNYF